MLAATHEVGSGDPGRVTVQNHGSIWLFEGTNDAARAELAALVSTEPWQWLGRALAVDHRFGAGLAEYLRSHGLEVVCG
jgi:hypothetical protein